MYERSYGYRYDETRDASTVEIAKVIRADVKQAVSEGLLPSRWTYSIRADHGTSIDVEVRDCPDAWQECDGTVPGSRTSCPDGSASFAACPDVWCAGRKDPAYAHGAKVHQTLTAEARVAKMTLERIHGAYNHDGSEIQIDYFDVRYYGHVSFEDAGSADFRKREAERLAERKANREAGTFAGKAVNYKRDGAVYHVVVKTPAGKEVLGCGARISGGSWSRAADDAEVTCSRCAKRAATLQASAAVRDC